MEASAGEGRAQRRAAEGVPDERVMLMLAPETLCGGHPVILILHVRTPTHREVQFSLEPVGGLTMDPKSLTSAANIYRALIKCLTLFQALNGLSHFNPPNHPQGGYNCNPHFADERRNREV